MTKAYYLPKSDKELVPWFNKFDKAFTTVAPTLGFTPAEITAVNNDYLAVKYMYDDLDFFKGELQERTQYKDLLFNGDEKVALGPFPTVPTLPVAPTPVKAGVFKRIIKVVQRVKVHPNYNDSIGKNLGIIGTEQVIDLNTVKPIVSVKAITSKSITLDFLKGGLEGVIIYAGTPYHVPAQEGGTTPSGETTEAEVDWVELARMNHSPFVDIRENSTNKPETRYYKFQYLKKDKAVGMESDIIRVVSPIFKAGSDLANKVK